MSEQSVIDHLSTYASDYERTRDFYSAALSPLGVRLVTELTTGDGTERICAFGTDRAKGSVLGYRIKHRIHPPPPGFPCGVTPAC